jgi:hypothetical protein
MGRTTYPDVPYFNTSLNTTSKELIIRESELYSTFNETESVLAPTAYQIIGNKTSIQPVIQAGDQTIRFDPNKHNIKDASLELYIQYTQPSDAGVCYISFNTHVDKWTRSDWNPSPVTVLSPLVPLPYPNSNVQEAKISLDGYNGEPLNLYLTATTGTTLTNNCTNPRNVSTIPGTVKYNIKMMYAIENKVI